MSKPIEHIDNNFFKLTASQAKFLSCDGRLPRAGWEKRADSNKVSGLELKFKLFGGRERIEPAGKRFGWIKKTRLSYWAGKPVKSGVVWAIHFNQFEA